MNRKEVIDVEEAVDVVEVDDAIPKDQDAPRAMNDSSFLSHGLGILDSFLNSSSDEGELSEAELQAADATAARKLSQKKLNHWCDYEVDCRSMFLDIDFLDEPQPIPYFLQLDVGLVYQKII